MPTTTFMTTEELLALPDDGIRRWLIAGELRPRPHRSEPHHNRVHGRVMTRAAKFLDNWLDAQPEPRGLVLTGDAGIRLTRDPDTTVGADVLYVTADVLARQTAEVTVIEGIPILVVEDLSPNTTVEELNEKIDAYLAAGVPLVWIIDPYRRTVLAHRPGEDTVLFASRQEPTAEPRLPGFRVPVAELFA